jgi:hypothetical protein
MCRATESIENVEFSDVWMDDQSRLTVDKY